MKKVLSIALLILLTATLFVGCGGDASEDIIGTWSSTTDISKSVNGKINATGALKEALSVKDFERVTIVTYREDGYYEIKTDMNALANTFTAAKSKMKSNLIKTFASEANVNSALEASGMNIDSFVESIFSEAVMREIAGTPVAGKYEVDGDKLYLSATIDSKIDKNSYIEIDCSDDELIYEEYVGDGMDDLKKQKYTRVK